MCKTNKLSEYVSKILKNCEIFSSTGRFMMVVTRTWINRKSNFFDETLMSELEFCMMVEDIMKKLKIIAKRKVFHHAATFDS